MPTQTIAWNCTYHVLLAHAAAVKRFRAAVPGGKISMNINSDWSEPYSSSAQDQVHPLHVSEKRCKVPLWYSAMQCVSQCYAFLHMH